MSLKTYKCKSNKKKIKHKSIKGRYRIERFLKRPSIKKVKEKYKL